MSGLVSMIESKSIPTDFGGKQNIASKMGSISVRKLILIHNIIENTKLNRWLWEPKTRVWASQAWPNKRAKQKQAPHKWKWEPEKNLIWKLEWSYKP